MGFNRGRGVGVEAEINGKKVGGMEREREVRRAGHYVAAGEREREDDVGKAAASWLHFLSLCVCACVCGSRAIMW